jgi:hypothetical protein
MRLNLPLQSYFYLVFKLIPLGWACPYCGGGACSATATAGRAIAASHGAYSAMALHSIPHAKPAMLR